MQFAYLSECQRSANKESAVTRAGGVGGVVGAETQPIATADPLSWLDCVAIVASLLLRRCFVSQTNLSASSNSSCHALY